MYDARYMMQDAPLTMHNAPLIIESNEKELGIRKTKS